MGKFISSCGKIILRWPSVESLCGTSSKVEKTFFSELLIAFHIVIVLFISTQHVSFDERFEDVNARWEV